jgi:hypothetical protein
MQCYLHRIVVLALSVAFWLSAGIAEAQLRVVTWNVSNYTSGRVSEFQTAIYGTYSGRTMSPDIFIGQEFLSQTGVNNFLNLLNTAAGSPGDWAAATFVNGPDTDSAFFYRTSKVFMATDLDPDGVTVVATGGVSPNHPRNIMRYDVRLVGETSPQATIAFYSTHMKASTGSENQARRLLEAQRIRDDAESLPEGWNFALGGDFNIAASTEGAYVELVGSQANNDGRFFDPIKTPGSWKNNSSFKIVHTQDPRGPGGMDDRHDQLLISGGLIDGIELDYDGNPNVAYSTTTWNDPNHSYRSWGNDGTTYNTTMRITNNGMVGTTIAQAIYDTVPSEGGHLPVFLDLELIPCDPCDVDCSGDVDDADIEAFVGLLLDPGQSRCSSCAGDTDDLDPALNGDDIQLFVECFTGGA